MPSMFHGGHRQLQDKYGGRAVADRLEQHRKRTEFSETDRAFIEQAHFFFLATAHEDVVDCSYKGGVPGFVKIAGPDRLYWPDYDGNRMYRSLGNIVKSPAVGMLFISFDRTNDAIPASETRRLRVNGYAEVVDEGAEFEALRADTPGAQRFVFVTVREIFTNCNRYLPDMGLREHSMFLPRAGCAPPEPEWKSRDYIKDVIQND